MVHSGAKPGFGAAPTVAAGLWRRRCCCCLVGGPGLGRQLLGLGPLRGDACSARRKVQLSLPPSPIPLLLSFPFFSPSLPASHSCCLGDPASVREEAAFLCKAQGRGQLPLQDGEGRQRDEHTHPWGQSPALWFG